MNSTRTIIVITIATIALMIGGTLVLTKSTEPDKAQEIQFVEGGKAVAPKTQKDWGDIAFEGGNKEETFVIKNEGTQTLRIRRIRTSCHCTKAQVSIGDVVSPSFGMNSDDPWVGEVPEGEEAKVKVTFDPAFHGVNGLGPITRYVTVETSDPQNKTIEFSVSGFVKK